MCARYRVVHGRVLPDEASDLQATEVVRHQRMVATFLTGEFDNALELVSLDAAKDALAQRWWSFQYGGG